MKRIKNWIENTGVGLLVIAMLAVPMALIGGVWYGYSYMEARSFNNVTGSNVSAFDAMFVQLRVQDGSNSK